MVECQGVFAFNVSCCFYYSMPDVHGNPRDSHRILLNIRETSILTQNMSVNVEGKTILEHGYMPDVLGDSHVYFIDLKEELEPGTTLKIQFTE